MIKENNNFVQDLAKIKAEGLYKNERTITTPQGVTINTEEHGDALNFCSNNYLGLSNNNEIKEAAKDALEKYGFGMMQTVGYLKHYWVQMMQLFLMS